MKIDVRFMLEMSTQTHMEQHGILIKAAGQSWEIISLVRQHIELVVLVVRSYYICNEMSINYLFPMHVIYTIKAHFRSSTIH